MTDNHDVRIPGRLDPARAEQPVGDAVSLVELLAVALRHRRVVITAVLATTILMVFPRILQPRTYTAVGSFVPAGAEGGAGGGLSGLAAQFGFSAAAAGESPLFYAELLTSREVLAQSVVERYPQRPLPGADAVRIDLITAFQLHDSGPEQRLEEAIRRLRNNVRVETNRETGIVSFQVTMKDPELASGVAGNLIGLLNAFNLTRRQLRASAEREFVQGRLADVSGDLRTAEESLELFLRDNRQFMQAPHLVFQHDRLQRDVMLRQQLMITLTQVAEQARVEELRNVPVLMTLQHPVPPDRPDSRRLLRRGVMSLLLGAGLGLFLAFARESWRRAAAQSGQAAEVRRLGAEALTEVLRPWLLLRRPSRPGRH
jgi:uncharacterized protein involved in exopolysaccharide biosynthesis